MNPDSTIEYIKKDDGKLEQAKVNPFRSRSTIIAISCIIALLVLAWMTIVSGYFNETFSAACLMLLTNIVYAFTNHQRETDRTKMENGKEATK